MSSRDQYSTLQSILISTRKSRGLTQSEVADRLKKPQSFVSKYESGERRLDVIEFIEVCKALNINPVSIVKKLGADEK